MILSLTSDHFTLFGSLLSPEALPCELSAGKKLRAQKSRLNGYCYPDSRVCLGGEEGSAVLAVSLNKTDFSYFFLDAPVCLHPKVYFALVPFSDSCTARILVPRNAQAERFLDWKRLSDFPSGRYPRVTNMLSLQRFDTEPAFFFKGESHRAFELLYVADGAMHVSVNGFQWQLNRGELLLIAENQWHTFSCGIGQRASFCSLTFELSDADALPLLDRIFKAPDCMDSVLSDIEKDMEQPDVLSQGMCQTGLQKLLLRILRQNQEEAPQKLPPQGERHLVAEAMRYIAAHCRDGLSVGDVAEGINISPSYLTALFQKCLQGAPGDYIRRARLEESRAMIREGKQNMTRIAQTLHYSTVYHFSRQFKDKYGITPTQYARMFHQ